jgi:hypothetical protein
MTLSFREAAIVASRLCLALAAGWMGAPQCMLWVGQIDGSLSTLLMARFLLGAR